MAVHIHTCNHCKQTGGTPLGENRDGLSVCTLCGTKDDLDEPVHNAEWSLNNGIPNNKKYRKKPTFQNDK